MSFLSIALLASTLGLSVSQPAVATQEDASESVFFLVRHSERADDSKDSPLSEVGHERSRRLASLLRDAGIDTIYSSDFQRTRDTAQPLCEELGIDLTLYDRDNLPELTRILRSTPGRYLIVGHSDTIPETVRWLGGDPGSDMAIDEYDRLYVLTHRAGVGTTTTLLRIEVR